MGDIKIKSSDFVNLHISTSQNDLSFNERRFAKDLTISDLKAKLELTTGGSCATMKLEVYDKENKLVCPLNDDEAMLGSYPLEDGMRLHVIDKFTMRSEMDGSNVEKYEMPPDEYAKKSDTVRAYLVRNKLGNYNEDYIKKKQQQEEEEKKLADSIVVGSRCKVTVPNAPERLGTVMYAGLVDGIPGYWAGVKYDEPLGKNNGSVKGKEYFKCPPNYGAFVKPQHILCGDFPEQNYDLDDEI